MDLWHTISKVLDHDRYKVVGLLIVIGVVFYFAGCESTTKSISDSGTKVGRSEFLIESQIARSDLAKRRIALDADIAIFNADAELVNKRIDAGVADLERQDVIKADLFDLVGSAVTGWISDGASTAGIVGTLITALSIAGFGTSYADGRRKDREIAKIKDGK